MHPPQVMLFGAIAEWAQQEPITPRFGRARLANSMLMFSVAVAAHDLKTPVTAIKGYAQIALRVARRSDQPRLLQHLR